MKLSGHFLGESCSFGLPYHGGKTHAFVGVLLLQCIQHQRVHSSYDQVTIGCWLIYISIVFSLENACSSPPFVCCGPTQKMLEK